MPPQGLTVAQDCRNAQQGLTSRSDEIWTALKLSSSFQVGCWNPTASPVRFTCRPTAGLFPWWRAACVDEPDALTYVHGPADTQACCACMLLVMQQSECHPAHNDDARQDYLASKAGTVLASCSALLYTDSSISWVSPLNTTVICPHLAFAGEGAVHVSPFGACEAPGSVPEAPRVAQLPRLLLFSVPPCCCQPLHAIAQHGRECF